MGNLPLSPQLASCVHSLAAACAEHELNEVEVAWIQTGAPAPNWAPGQEVQGLRLKVSRGTFHLVGRMTEPDRQMTTQTISVLRLAQAPNFENRQASDPEPWIDVEFKPWLDEVEIAEAPVA
ncbi:hypothetical protein [Polaromonas sp.]|uniref:hypothetical protein n=1 Tax=Polaromonas sp. TaxID=1869339 RepID=UPI00352B77F6